MLARDKIFRLRSMVYRNWHTSLNEFAWSDGQVEGLKRNRVSVDNRVERELDIVDDAGVGEFGDRPLDGDGVPKLPSAQGIEGYDLNQRPQRPAGCLLFVGSITKNFGGQHFLQLVNGRVRQLWAP